MSEVLGTVGYATTSMPTISSTSGQVLVTTGSTPTWSSISTGTTQMTSTGMIYCQPIETYAWTGFNFALFAVGILILVGAACLAYSSYKYHNPEKNHK